MEPLIYTIKGNLPVSSLEYSGAVWTETDQYIQLYEEWKLDGEVVRNNVHIKLKAGVDANVEQALFGG